ncbi:TetR/AcrR family transcriptional regulator [Mycobacterium spongiae]|uniref:TetR family transcriptional regulator n=1 Tax=Mycobacterium spongiae TaxID=886343 RepID=A0A975JY15_9MYCO|nr:TetR/AcrR family transcriptional regulator [Mycobacterium spongiae]QUR67821.1 TetR family transcriptional regulator [Mycobacterium spongiae]
MRSHGWSGNTPNSDEEAIDRILDAADHIIAQRGSSTRIADVAQTLGVTRQTVYRYFPGTEALLVAAAMRSADGFLDQLAEHIKGETDPVAAMVEGVAFVIETLAEDRHFQLLITQRRRGGRTVSITSETALTFGRAMLHRLDINWEQHGFDEAALAELSEFSIRIVSSYVADPGQPPREGIELRRFLTRWFGPAVLYPRLAKAMDTLKLPVPGPKRRRSSAVS